MQLIPNAKQQFIDQNGLPLASGTVGFYFPGTLNPKPTYQDAAGTIANTNPVTLDSRGQALIWGSGVYRQIVKDASGVTIWDQVTEDANAGLTGNITNARWVAGASYTDPVGATPGTFVPGTTTTFNLPVQPGSITNLWPFFDASFQADDQIASVNGTSLIFASAVPVGVQEVEVKIGSTIAIGTPGDGTVTDAKVAVGSALYNRLKMWFDVKDFGAIGNGTTDDTASIQAAINAANAAGGTCLFSPGRYLCGALTVNAANGGAIFAVPGTAHLLPNANNVAFFTLVNAQNFGVGYTIDGVTFDNSAIKTGCVGVSVVDYEQIVVQNITSIRMAYIVNATATAGGPNSFNLSIRNIVQYGCGSIQVAGLGVGAQTGRCFNTEISNVTQFSGGGDTWAAPWITMQRAINSMISDVTSETISAGTNGIVCIGACEGVFMSNIVLVNPKIGILCNDSNGDTALPAYIYLSNVAVDQPTISGMDITALTMKGTNVNVTFGNAFNNVSPGCFIRTGSSDICFWALKINNMFNDGLTVQPGCSGINFYGCNFTTNGTSGSGFDVNIAANTARDPFLSGCVFGTFSTSGTGTVLNGSGTSRYVNSQRAQTVSNGTTNQVVATYTLPANSLVNGKTLRIVSSGICAANANAKSITVQIGGITVAAMSGVFNGLAYRIEGEVYRVDASNVWMDGKTFAGSTCGVTSALQNPFNSVGALVVTLLVSTVAASDVVINHFDVELID
jgi:predicted heme/steroid binding protein